MGVTGPSNGNTCPPCPLWVLATLAHPPSTGPSYPTSTPPSNHGECPAQTPPIPISPHVPVPLLAVGNRHLQGPGGTCPPPRLYQHPSSRSVPHTPRSAPPAPHTVNPGWPGTPKAGLQVALNALMSAVVIPRCPRTSRQPSMISGIWWPAPSGKW